MSIGKYRGALLLFLISALIIFSSSPSSFGGVTLDYLPAITAVDSFEQIGSPLDNFTNVGTLVNTSKNNPFTGSYSLHQNVTGSGLQYKNSITGSTVIEIMFYDSLVNSASASMSIDANGNAGEIGIDSGISTTYGTYYFANNTNLYTSGISRSMGWHNFTFYLEQQASNYYFHIYLDGNLLASQFHGTYETIDQLYIAGGGPGSTPDYYWDDFSIREPGSKSPLFYITETSTVTETTTQNNTLTTTVTSNNTVTSTNTVTENQTVTVTGNQTETLTTIINSISTFVSNITHFDTVSTNFTSTKYQTTTEYTQSDEPPGIAPPSFTLSSDFLLGMAASIALIIGVFVIRRFYG